MAAAKAVVLLILAWVGFLLIPDRLVIFLSTRVSPNVRDTLATLWVVAAFLALCWAFLALQRWRRA